jgi:acyl-CoA thioester hydrolase
MTDTMTTNAAGRRLAREIDTIDYAAFRVLPDYIDPNGHMNVGYYGVLFDRASDLPCSRIGIGWDMIERTNRSIFTLESHVTFQHEILEGQPLTFRFQLLDYDPKRVHMFMSMHHRSEGWLAATYESINMCIDMATRRAAEWPADVMDSLGHLHAEHRNRPRPAEVGRVIGIRRKAAP